MFKCSASDEERPDFLPFTLHMKLTTKETATNLYRLLLPFVFALDKARVNKEQRQMAEDICNTISQNVANINS